jgi:hypothetical protein
MKSPSIPSLLSLRPSRIPFAAFLLVILLSLGARSPIQASTETWDGNGTNNNWTNDDNWAGLGGVGADDDLVFPPTAARKANHNDFVNTNFHSLNFNGPDYVITGNQVTLTNGILNNPGGGTSAIFNPDITLGANQFFINQTNDPAPLTFNGIVNLNFHTLTIAAGGTSGDDRILMNGLITGTGTLVTVGVGTTILTGNSPSFGTTLIQADNGGNAGPLQVDGTIGNVQLSSGTLSGTGTVGGIDASLPSGPNDGIISPGIGNAPGILTAAGFVEFAATSTYAVDLNGITFPGQYDRLNVTSGSSVSLNGANLDVSLGFIPSAGQQFTIIQIIGAGSRLGQFAQGTSILVNGRAFSITYNLLNVVLTVRPALQLTSAVSRKTHGAAGTFDVSLPSSPFGIECRSGVAGDTFVITFSNPVVSGFASVTSGTGNVSGAPVFSGNTMTVNLTGVADAQVIGVTLSGVTDSFGQVLPNTAVGAKILLGDTNNSSSVSAADIAQTKAQAGNTVGAGNFRSDTNVSGSISAGDIAQVKANSGHNVP